MVEQWRKTLQGPAKKRQCSTVNSVKGWQCVVMFRLEYWGIIVSTAIITMNTKYVIY